ncbi:unnamed protein product [Thlaspi arvense]|uniref:Fungal lipase-type domain-containing protein n=1 Tax=Thlaspi arvense TaxID=13288 RepID=A0AAU9RRU7_THLAR|nr:unnamed protein product [Thlaspi arvense]
MCTTENYFVLDPREANASDLIRLLFCSQLRNRRFINSSEERKLEDDLCRFRRRWIIFVTIVIQKLMILIRKPLYLFGFSLAYWLNLVSSNDGFFMILPNLFKGKIIWPEESSATFASLNGNLDRRVELDQRIKRGSKRYKAMLSIMASKLSYENINFVSSVLHNHWKMDLLGFYSCWNGYEKQRSTEVIVIKDTSTDPNLIIVSFRGTDPFDTDDWCTDLDLSWRHLKEILDQNPTCKFILTGHSLGGALAILFTSVLMIHEEEQMLDKLEGVYTFGQPRVGDEEFGKFMKGSLKKFEVNYERYVYCNDMVPRLPFDDKTLMFKHFGACLFYDSFYRGKVSRGRGAKQKLLQYVIGYPEDNQRILGVDKEFHHVLLEGDEYKEGWFLRCFRVVVLLIPGLPAHFPNEYVNVTLLGDLPDPHLD